MDLPFDLSWHLRRITSPAPHTPDTVIDFARKAAMTAFDPSRPLWEFTLIEDVKPHRAALVMKVHHSLTDGAGGIQLALLLFDTHEAPTAPRSDAKTVKDDLERLSTADLVRDSLAHNRDRVQGFLARRITSSIPEALRTARHPLQTLDGTTKTIASIGRMVAPVSQTLSPIMAGRSLDRHLDILELGLSDLKAAARSAGATLNDGFMAGVVGGLRRYHERHSTVVNQLRVTLPVSVRLPTDPLGGNRISLLRFAVPVADPDPAARMVDLHRLCHAARQERAVPFSNGIAGVLNLLPPSLVGSMVKHVDFVASDVTGFDARVYLAGAALERLGVFGPTLGTSLNVTLLSYNGTCSVGVNMDPAAIPDPDTMAGCLKDGFEEVLALAGPHGSVVLPLRQRPHRRAAKAAGAGAPIGHP
jgi:WS/DGAT/MGAT family acyltransferase